MKTLFLLGILCIWLDSVYLRLMHRSICRRCVQELCPPRTSLCNGLELDDCSCCAVCANFLGNGLTTSSYGRHKQSSKDDAGQVVHYEKSAAVQTQQGDSVSPELQHNDISSLNAFPRSITSLHTFAIPYRNTTLAFTLTPYPLYENEYTYGTSSHQTDQIPFSKERSRGSVGNIEALADDSTPIADDVHKTIIKETKQPLTDKIKNCIGNLSQQTCQATVNSGTTTVNPFLADRESQPAVTGDTKEISVTNTHFATVDAHTFFGDETTAAVSRAKRESELIQKRVGAVEMHQVLKDGNIILQMLTDNAPQQVIYCALSQTFIPGSYILADSVRTIMEVIHKLATFISEKFFIENPNSLKGIVIESIDKGFAKASTLIPEIADEIKEFLSKLIELGSDENVNDKPTQVLETTLKNIKTYLESLSMSFEEATTTVMRQRVKSDIMELVFSGSKTFAEIVDAIMNISNAISKSVLESAFITEKPSLQNLLEAMKNSIIAGVTKGFEVASEVIHVTIEGIEKDSFIHKDDTSKNYLSSINGHNVEPLTTPEVITIRPTINAYLQFICDNSMYSNFNIWGEQLTVSSPSIRPSVLAFLIEVHTHIMETLMHMENIVCTSKVLEETHSWNNLLEAGNLVNEMIFKRLALFQLKYNLNSNELNQLLNDMGCNGTIKRKLSDEDSVVNKTLVEIIQIGLKSISNELKMKTDEMIASYKNLSIKLSELPGGNVINIITEIVLQAVNEMSRKMNESPFITETPTWFNLWFSVVNSMTEGTAKALDVFIEFIDSTKSSSHNKIRGKEALRTDRSHERHKRELPNKVSSQDISERNTLEQASLGSSYHNILHPSSAVKVQSKSSNLKLLVDNLILTLRKSRLAHIEAAPEILITTINSARSPSLFPKKKSNTVINRAKREIELSMKRIGAVRILHEVLKDGSILLQMLTNSATQQVMHCTLSQLSIPGSYILADTARTIMEAIHESVVYISQSKSVATWDSLMQGITEAIERGFAKASTSVPKIVDGVIQFLSFNPTLTELCSNEKVKDAPTHAIETILQNIKIYLSSISNLLEVVTNTKMRQRVKSEITELAISGSEIFAQLADGIMNITNVISKSLLESVFMKAKPSLENLLETVKNSIIVGVTKGFKVAPEVIHLTIKAMEKNGVIYKNDTSKIDLSSINGHNVEQLTILKATEVRPIMNAYLQFICDNFRYFKPTLWGKKLAEPSHSNVSSVSEFFTEVDTYIMKTLTDIENTVCTSKILEETDSWNQLLQASKLINNTVFERLTLFQSKYHFNSTNLNQLLNRMGCNDAIKSKLSHKDSVGNKTFVEIIQIILKYLSTEVRMKTDEMITSIKKLSIKLAKLPGGNVINTITEISIQTVNEMARKMSESVFVIEPPTWFNFWFSLIDVVRGGGMKVADVYAELIDSTRP